MIARDRRASNVRRMVIMYFAFLGSCDMRRDWRRMFIVMDLWMHWV